MMKSFLLPPSILLGSILPFLPLVGQNNFQEPVISEREFRFREVEQRALDLSRRLSEITGTEPVQLIDRNQSFDAVRYQNSAQRSFDALPGPLQELEPLPDPEEEEEKAQPLVFASEVKRVVPTTQQRKGDYYIMPMVGLVFSGENEYTSDSINNSLEADFGNSIALSIGRRFDNWHLYGKVAYNYLDFETTSWMISGRMNQVKASEETYSASFHGGYSVPLSTKLSTNGGIGIGLGWRQHIVNRSYLLRGSTANQVDQYSSLVFTYELSLGFEYLFVNNFSGYLGYRVMGLSSNESFEGAFQHIIELGVGANF